MARSLKKVRTPPRAVTQLQTFNEANVGRLGLISVQERIPAEYTTWRNAVELDGREGEISCFSPSEVGGIPHGIDGDFATVLAALYIEQGAPDDAYVHTTAYQLIQRAGFEDTGAYYDRLQSSLRRLRAAQYSIGQAWRRRRDGGGGWGSVEFSYVSQIRQSTPEGRDYTRGTTLSIQLGEPVAMSIRARYLHPLDLEFLTSLKRPLTRALYRLLNGQRFDDQDPTRPAASFKTTVTEWGWACKLVETVPARIKRNLVEAHEELLARGYLSSVVFEGRGRNATVTYVFADAEPESPDVQVVPDPAVVEALVAHKVARSVARTLVRTHGETHVAERLAKFEAIAKSNYNMRNRAAVLVDVIKDTEGKYPDPEGFVSRERVESAEAARRARAASARIEEEQADQRHVALPFEERVAEVMAMVKMLVKPHLSEGVLHQLHAAVLARRVDVEELRSEALSAAKELRMQHFVEELRQLAGAPG